MEKGFEIIFEDEHVVVINKIARIVVVPTPKKEEKTLTSLVRKALAKKVYVCHRLDKETQGLMIYAKSSQVMENITDQFRRRNIIKKYFALSKGNFKDKEGVFRSLVLDKEGKKYRESPKRAETAYKVIKSCQGFDLLEIIPKTGRTNQIRIHLARAGHPILGEKKYAFRRDFVIKSNQLALCAYFLSFRHPASQKKIKLQVGVPEYMQKLIEKRG